MRNRIVDAIRGAFVADAASMGTHWHYSVNELMNVLPSFEHPEFKNPPTPNYYDSKEFPGHYEAGMLSPYGEQLMFMAEYCAKMNKIEGEPMSHAMYDWANTFGGRKDHSLVEFMENMSKEDGSGQWPNCGSNDEQAHCLVKVVPVTCMFAGRPERKRMVEDAILVHQNNENTVLYGLTASSILEAVLMGSTIHEALEKCASQENLPAFVRNAIQTAKDETNESLSDLLGSLGKFGRSYLLPPAFTSLMHVLFNVAGRPPSDRKVLFEQALRNNIRAGGDTCGRSIIIGAIIGAAFGGPPKDWLNKVDQNTMKKIDSLADAIADRAMGVSI